MLSTMARSWTVLRMKSSRSVAAAIGVYFGAITFCSVLLVQPANDAARAHEKKVQDSQREADDRRERVMGEASRCYRKRDVGFLRSIEPCITAQDCHPEVLRRTSRPSRKNSSAFYPSPNLLISRL